MKPEIASVDVTKYLSEEIIKDVIPEIVSSDDGLLKIFMHQVIGTCASFGVILRDLPKERQVACVDFNIYGDNPDDDSTKFIITLDDIKSLYQNICAYRATKHITNEYITYTNIIDAVKRVDDRISDIKFDETKNDASRIGGIVSEELTKEETTSTKTEKSGKYNKSVTQWIIATSVFDAPINVIVDFVSKSNDGGDAYTCWVHVDGIPEGFQTTCAIRTHFIAWNLVTFMVNLYREKYLTAIQTTKKMVSTTLNHQFYNILASQYADIQKTGLFRDLDMKETDMVALSVNKETQEQSYGEFRLKDKDGTPVYSLVFNHGEGKNDFHLFTIDGMTGGKNPIDTNDDQTNAIMKLLVTYWNRSDDLVKYAMGSLSREYERVEKQLKTAPWMKDDSKKEEVIDGKENTGDSGQ